MPQPSRRTIYFGFMALAVLAVLGYLALADKNGEASSRATGEKLTLADIPFNGERAYRHLKELCELGPRPSGSAAMARQQKLLTDHFKALGGDVIRQEFRVRHPETGQPLTMANIIVHWHPDRAERILLCAHYDTRPFPDRDRRRPRGTFVGANDGASGVAVLAELAQHMPAFKSRYGVDFVLFDGEEFVFRSPRDDDKYFLGSTYFARQYAAQRRGGEGQPASYGYRAGVLLDMVGDAHLEIYQERQSARWAATKGMVDDIWRTARDLGVSEFIARPRHEIRDDHLPLNKIARIPTCDIIDFDYPRRGYRQNYWHTEADTPDKCSALSLAKVGWVVHQWLKRLK